MKTIIDLLRGKRPEILEIAKRYGASNLRVFGSVARDEAGPGSDIDLMVDFRPGWTLWDLIGLKQDLEDLLGCQVDVVPADRLRDIVRQHALEEAVQL